MGHADPADRATRRTMPIAVPGPRSVPTHSRTEWAPRSPVRSARLHCLVTTLSLTTSVAPNSSPAQYGRDGGPDNDSLGAEAPSGDDAAQATAPSPMMATVEPRVTLAKGRGWLIPITSDGVSRKVSTRYPGRPAERQAFRLPGTRSARPGLPDLRSAERPSVDARGIQSLVAEDAGPIRMANGITTKSPSSACVPRLRRFARRRSPRDPWASPSPGSIRL